jgi:hypothetical protein
MKTAYPAQPETLAARSKRAWAAAGDARTQIQGKLDQAAGAQDLYGQTADAARDTAAPLLTSGFAGPSKLSPIRRRW